jgi:hypothetical protein
MESLGRYLILIEFGAVGYIIDSSDCLQTAEERIAVAFTEQQHSLSTQIIRHNADVKLLPYKVHPTGKYFINYRPTGFSNGFVSAYIFDTYSVRNFSIKQFCFERTYTIYAFEMDDYDTDKSHFVTEALTFIAN